MGGRTTLIFDTNVWLAKWPKDEIDMLNMFTSLITGLALIAGLFKGSKGNMMYVIVIVLAGTPDIH